MIDLNHQRIYFKNLDGARFFAFFLVFFMHCFISIQGELENGVGNLFHEFFQFGFLGVDFFFVLSGFLISWVIMREKITTSGFNFKKFVIRRTLRIWPLYFLIVFLGYGLFYSLEFFSQPIERLPSFYHFGLFILNYNAITDGVDYLIFMTFLWTISIEEQFYLFTALIHKLIRKVSVLWMGILFIITSLIFRFIFINESAMLYYHTVSVLGNFGIGMVVAYIATHWRTIESFENSKIISAFIYVLLIVSLIFYNRISGLWLVEWGGKLYFSVLFGYVILEQCFFKNRLFNLGKNSKVRYLGKISYGLYCFHGVVITLLLKLGSFLQFDESGLHQLVVYPLLIFAVTILVSSLSYKYYEGLFLKLKNKLD